MKLFYSKLYTAERLTKDKNLIENFFEGMPKLTDEISNQCEGDLTEDEIFQCLNTFPNGKSPGTDGLSVEWYKRFWPDIKDFLLKSINCSVQNGHLSLTQTQGIITVIPKKDKDPLFVKNWRPISLLNQDYKLIAKCIANCIKSTLPNIIHEDQTGFMKNRYIGENLIKIFALMTYSKQKDLKNYLVTIDFEKAFDYLDKEYIFFCLKFFNFGADIINWVKLLYNNSNSCVINNGNFTEFFPINRGVRQGCPLSPYIFILCVESLAHCVRKNEHIKGIEIKENKHIISQYADDTSLLWLRNRPLFLNLLKL